MNSRLKDLNLQSVPTKIDSATDTGKFRIISSYDEFDEELTEAGLQFLNLCDGQRTLGEIAGVLRERFKPEQTGEEDAAVLAFCRYLCDKNLLRV